MRRGHPVTTLVAILLVASSCGTLTVEGDKRLGDEVSAAGQGPKGTKLGFVDLRKVTFAWEEGKKAEKDFRRLAEEKQTELRPKEEELQRLKEEYEKQKYVLSADALKERRLEIMKRTRDLERDMREAEDELQIKQVQLLQPIQKQVIAVIERVGKEQGFTMIVDKTTQGLLYYSESQEITDLVIERLSQH